MAWNHTAVLPQDLKQRDAVCAALRGLVKAQCGMADAAIDEQLDAKVAALVSSSAIQDDKASAFDGCLG
eukprot:scaffold27428_cov21-Tisochrysis_lutea.AAC.5